MQTVERFNKYFNQLEMIKPYRMLGQVEKITGLVIESSGPAASIGELCHVTMPSGKSIRAEVVGFQGKKVLLPIEHCQTVSTVSLMRVRLRLRSGETSASFYGRSRQSG